MNREIPKVAQAATLLGIVSQLYNTRMNSLLGEHNFTLSQFSLLTHLARSEKSAETIAEITAGMEMNQPGVTKLVRKLGDEGLVNIAVDPKDSRKRQVSITSAGGQKIMQVSQSMFPDVGQWFEGWDEAELAQFIQHLGRLAGWLDSNRLEVK